MTSEEAPAVPRHPNDDKSDASSPRSVFHASPDTDSTGSSAGRPSPALASPASGGHGQWRSLVQAWKRKSMRRLATFPPVVLGSSSGISKRYLDRRLAQLRWEDDDDGGGDVTVGRADAGVRNPSWRCFGSAELAAATNNFCSENLIGKGGHAEVYRGQLPDGELVAVKRLMKKDSEDERVGDFLSELGIIAHIDHPNAARLLGFGVEDGLHFVLQLSPHGSLASLLHGSEDTLDWGIRFKVAVGVAEGLLYLHQGCKRRIIHRDIKASNILLGEDYEPQISDFGLAKWLPQQWTHHVVFPIEGTFGYLAPEYFMHGIVDEKTDVFAFGVLLLELITGRRAVDSSLKSLVMWAKPLLETRNVKELIDPSLGDSYNCTHVKRMILTASMCINHVATKRPHMNQVVQILKGEDRTGEVMSREQKPVGVKAILLDTFDLEDYTSSKYLNDLNRHKQLALE